MSEGGVKRVQPFTIGTRLSTPSQHRGATHQPVDMDRSSLALEHPQAMEMDRSSLALEHPQSVDMDRSSLAPEHPQSVDMDQSNLALEHPQAMDMDRTSLLLEHPQAVDMDRSLEPRNPEEKPLTPDPLVQDGGPQEVEQDDGRSESPTATSRSIRKIAICHAIAPVSTSEGLRSPFRDKRQVKKEESPDSREGEEEEKYPVSREEEEEEVTDSREEEEEEDTDSREEEEDEDTNSKEEDTDSGEEEEREEDTSGSWPQQDVLRCYEQDLQLALDVSSFYQQADSILNTIISQNSLLYGADGRRSSKLVLIEIENQIGIMEETVWRLSRLHPTLADRVMRKRTEVQDSWSHLKDISRGQTSPLTRRPAGGSAEPGLRLQETTTSAAKTLSWLKDNMGATCSSLSAALEEENDEGEEEEREEEEEGEEEERKVEPSLLALSISQLLSGCAEVSMDIMEQEREALLCWVPAASSSTLNALQEQQDQLEVDYRIVKGDVDELEELAGVLQGRPGQAGGVAGEGFRAVRQAWEELGWNLTENRVRLVQFSQLQDFLQSYQHMIAWAEEARKGVFSEAGEQEDVRELDLRMEQQMEDFDRLAQAGRRLVTDRHQLAAIIKERTDELHGMLGWILAHWRTQRKQTIERRKESDSAPLNQTPSSPNLSQGLPEIDAEKASLIEEEEEEDDDAETTSLLQDNDEEDKAPNKEFNPCLTTTPSNTAPNPAPQAPSSPASKTPYYPAHNPASKTPHNPASYKPLNPAPKTAPNPAPNPTPNLAHNLAPKTAPNPAPKTAPNPTPIPAPKTAPNPALKTAPNPALITASNPAPNPTPNPALRVNTSSIRTPCSTKGPPTLPTQDLTSQTFNTAWKRRRKTTHRHTVIGLTEGLKEADWLSDVTSRANTWPLEEQREEGPASMPINTQKHCPLAVGDDRVCSELSAAVARQEVPPTQPVSKHQQARTSKSVALKLSVDLPWTIPCDPPPSTKTQTQRDPPPSTKTQTQRDPGPRTKTQTERNPGPRTKTQTVRDPGPSTKTQTERDPGPRTKIQTKRDPGPRTKTQTERYLEPSTKTQTERDPGPSTKKQTERNPGPSTKTQTERDPGPRTGAGRQGLTKKAVLPPTDSPPASSPLEEEEEEEEEEKEEEEEEDSQSPRRVSETITHSSVLCCPESLYTLRVGNSQFNSPVGNGSRRSHGCFSVHTKLSDLAGHIYHSPVQWQNTVAPQGAVPSPSTRVIVCSDHSCTVCPHDSPVHPERCQFEKEEEELEDIWRTSSQEKGP